MVVHHSKVEVVACAKIGGGHYEIIPFLPNYYPYDSVAGFEDVFLDSSVFDCFPSLFESLTEGVEEFVLVNFFDFFCFFCFVADVFECFEF